MKNTALLNGGSDARPIGKKRAKKEAQAQKGQWEEPTLEDVSQKVMAQPYIRFT